MTIRKAAEPIKRIHRFVLALVMVYSWTLPAQDDTLKPNQKFTASAFLELYYAYDFNEPENERRPDFLYNYIKHRQISLNLATVKFSYQTKFFRANLASMAGDALAASTSEEPNAVKYLLEANLGVRLTKQIWLDAGILPSHLGFESLISKEAFTLTRSMAAENSPYWESGARLECTLTKKWKLNIFYLNGWQQRWPQAANSQPSFGTQLIYTPNKKLLVNYSTFAGYPYDGNSQYYRLFHNFYGTWNILENTNLMLGFDVGTDRFPDKSFHTWCVPLLQLRQKVISNLYAGLRAEYFFDPDETLILTSEGKGFRVTGFSANVDYKLLRYLMLRFEWRMFQSDEDIFLKKETAVDQNQAVTGSIILSL